MTSMKKILLVEDSPTQAVHLQDLLEQAGLETVWASNGKAAVERIEEGAPDLIVFDCYLPDGGGDQLLGRMRAIPEVQAVPILVLVPQGGGEAEMPKPWNGLYRAVPKSVEADVLVAQVRKLLADSDSDAAPTHAEESYFRRARLLTIDDSATYLEYLDGELRQDGYQVDQAVSGKAGLDLVEGEPFDCVLVDLVMPELDGIEVCRQIDEWRRRGDSTVGILMVTAAEGKEDMTQALEAGADDFVSKSSDIAVIKGRIRALLRRKFYEEESLRAREEVKQKELEVERARIEKEAAEERAALADELARTADDLRRSNEDLQQFAYVVSHDLQQPLRMVSSYVQLLAKRYQGKLDADADQFIGFAVDGAERMKTLITDLLRLSRVGTRGQELSPTPCDVVLERTLRNLQVATSESGASVTHDPLPTVRGDETQLTQLFQNLVGNAIKFRGDDAPRVHISAREGTEDRRPETGDQRPCTEGKSPVFVFSVRDNGIGIDPEHAERIFKVFQRLHTEEEYDGTGIGLAVCRKIVERHGGRIWIESQVGEGATFYFTLVGSE